MIQNMSKEGPKKVTEAPKKVEEGRPEQDLVEPDRGRPSLSDPVLDRIDEAVCRFGLRFLVCLVKDNG